VNVYSDILKIIILRQSSFERIEYSFEILADAEEVVEVVCLAVCSAEARKRLDTTIILNQVIQNNNINQRPIQGNYKTLNW